MPSDTVITCPYCRAVVPTDTTICPDCQEDLSAILRLKVGYAIHYNEALALARDAKFDEAVAKALLAIEAKEDFAPAHALLAKVYAQRGDWTKAEASVARAVELAPEDEKVCALAEEIRRAKMDWMAMRQQEDEQTALARRHRAEQALAVYERDVKRAFGLGVGVTAFLAFILSLIGGRKRRG